MKHLLIFIAIILIPQISNAACTADVKLYTSCNAGYFLSGNYCNACAAGTYKPSSGTGTSCTTCPPGKTVGKSATASTDKTDCYIPSTAKWSFSDSTGSGTESYTSDCYYSN